MQNARFNHHQLYLRVRMDEKKFTIIANSFGGKTEQFEFEYAQNGTYYPYCAVQFIQVGFYTLQSF